MPDSAEYAVRRSAFEKPRVWRVDATGLSWSAAGNSGRFDFTEIGAIRLRWAASRADHARYSCEVIRFSGWTETIVSTHYAGPMQFPDQRTAYVPFVRELIRRTASANPRCKFQAGTTRLYYFLNIAILVFSVLLLALVGVSIGIPLTWLIVAKLIIIAFLFPLAIAWIKKNRPRRFAPANIPADVLPAPP